MKKNDYKRIERQLSPDDELVRSVMNKAEIFSAEPEKAREYLREHDIIEKPAISTQADTLSLLRLPHWCWCSV